MKFMVDSNNGPKEISVRVLGPWEYVTLYDKKESADVIKDLSWGDDPGHPGEPNDGLRRGSRGTYYKPRMVEAETYRCWSSG